MKRKREEVSTSGIMLAEGIPIGALGAEGAETLNAERGGAKHGSGTRSTEAERWARKLDAKR